MAKRAQLAEAKGIADRNWSRATKIVAETLGNNITMGRRRKHWTEEELASRARLSRSTIVKIEKGRGNVALMAVLEVCWLLEIPIFGTTNLKEAEVLLLRSKLDVEFTSKRVRARKGEVPSDAF